jgi:hypothetical protein
VALSGVACTEGAWRIPTFGDVWVEWKRLFVVVGSEWIGRLVSGQLENKVWLCDEKTNRWKEGLTVAVEVAAGVK